MPTGGLPRGGRRPPEWEPAVVEALAATWRWRLELTLLGAAVTLQRLLASRLGDVGSVVVVVALAAVVVAIAPARRVLWRALRRARLRRAWARAATDAGLADGPFRVPRVLGAAGTPAGDVLRVRVLRGQSAVALEARREELAACLRVREVRIERQRTDAADVRVTLVRRDPFERADPLGWSAASAESVSLWEPVPVGVDERGELVGMRLVERNVLVGGEPGAGKSVALSLLVAAGALDPARARVAAGRQARRAGRVGADRRASGRPRRRAGRPAVAGATARDGRALPRAARVRSPQGPPPGRAGARPMTTHSVATGDRLVVAELVVRICDRGPEPAWHTDRRLFGPWQRFEAELLGPGGPCALGLSPWEALYRLVANHRAELGARGVAS